MGPRLLLGLVAVATWGCSLTQFQPSACDNDDECAAAFGLGSACDAAGFCTDPPRCETGHDCRRAHGTGACVNNVCTLDVPVDDACDDLVEPEDLFTRLQDATTDRPLIIGGIFSLDEDFDKAQTMAVRLAIREINLNGGMVNGQPLGLVFCDNGGPGNEAEGDERIALNQHAIDYLGGTLGVPYLVGPLSSADSLVIVNRILSEEIPTVVISPSATSPALTKQSDVLPGSDVGLFWRTCPSDELQGKVLAENVVPAGLQVAVVHVKDAYGQGLAAVFSEIYGSTNATLFPFDDATDLATLATNVNNKSPDAVLVIAVQASDTVKVLTALDGTAVASKLFFFTDGSRDESKLFDPSLPSGVKAIIQNAKGTTPARPSGANYDFFTDNLLSEFNLNADAYSFLAQSYDATYVGAFGTVFAGAEGSEYDGRDVAEGLTRLSSGAAIDVRASTWAEGKGRIADGETINVSGASGPLDFDPKTGEAPGGITIWSVSPDGMSFVDEMTVNP